MGIEFAIFHHGAKTWVDLGKGAFGLIDPKDSLLTMAAQVCQDSCCFCREDPRGWALYSLWVCCKIYSFVRTGKWGDGIVEGSIGEVEVLSDCGPKSDRYYDLRDEYQKVGERYSTPEVYLEEVARWVPAEDIELLAADAIRDLR